MPKAFVIFLLFVIVVLLAFSLSANMREDKRFQQIDYWQVRWQAQNTFTSKPWNDDQNSYWTSSQLMKDGKPVNSSSAWIRIPLPELNWNTSGLLIRELQGKHVIVYLDDNKIYESRRGYAYEQNQLLLPLTRDDSFKMVYIWVESAREKIGLTNGILIGDYQDILTTYVSSDLMDVVIGFSFVLVALIMAFCSFFLEGQARRMWLSLCIVILALGVLVVTYSPFLFTFYPLGDRVYALLFDISLFVLVPAFYEFFENVFGKGYNNLIHRMKKVQYIYSILCLLALIGNALTHDRYFKVYYVMTVLIFGVFILVGLITFLIMTLRYARQQNRAAQIFAAGFSTFALITGFELIWYYVQDGDYKLVLWKWGVIFFVISLIAIMGRVFAENRRQAIEYSRQLELFNNELQRSEKMDIISELAASVAHEVRNPLQVTRGFLQLTQMNTDDKGREHLKMALDELDRAAGIITDFLTFAKPQFDQEDMLDLSQEFSNIENIMQPLASLQGGTLLIDVPEQLYIRGNSSKFKQACINIIKNGIEALRKDGNVTIQARRWDDSICIYIRDNGSGMDEQELARLGEPYFSNKTKGTGLGLMVTFRIIEAMGGQLEFHSKKGEGTEAVLTFPLITPV
ncbi:ATP-binding protein [Paenibacillus sp. WLX2291]|uniref:ATP-binding protein n=1 Tax=Paenibacillus sp. WLX2291 TaxID=3296934 RepID=UPI003983FDD6